MIYLYWYLGIGGMVLAVAYAAHYLMKEKGSGPLSDLLEADNPDSEKLTYHIVKNIVAPVLTAAVVIAAWPVGVYLKVRSIFQKKESSRLPVESEFAVASEHLLERLTVEAIQQREIVIDPLGAVPELPFGHLNAAWRAFLQVKADDAELWSFAADWQSTWGGKEQRCGYVVVQNGAPGPYFQTILKKVP